MKSIRIFLAVALFNIFPSFGFATPVDINAADASEIAEALSGVGPKTAQAIVDYRAKNGPFGAIQDLLKVKGIGPKTLERYQQDIDLGTKR
ncbi:MAG: helix-hairpin-helix domain-containing protein [Gammaproteobacteria bacterium]|nr:helix-hairpin-helix domain-containing protein [Gammaproteobacteria bacterium]